MPRTPHPPVPPPGRLRPRAPCRSASAHRWVRLNNFRCADPLDIASKTKEEIAWFRHAEIKHGRVAMAAFIGYTVQSLGVHFPGNLQQTPSPVTFADLSAMGPADQWDALSSAGKLQILCFVGLLEVRGTPPQPAKKRPAAGGAQPAAAPRRLARRPARRAAAARGSGAPGRALTATISCLTDGVPVLCLLAGLGRVVGDAR